MLDVVTEIVVEYIPFAPEHQFLFDGVKGNRLILGVMALYQVIEFVDRFGDLTVNFKKEGVGIFNPMIVLSQPILGRDFGRDFNGVMTGVFAR